MSGSPAGARADHRPRLRPGRAPGRQRRSAADAFRYSAPIFVLVLATGLSLFALPQLEAPGLQMASAALALDLTVVAPGLVYLLLVRAKRAPWLAILPTAVVGYALAVATIPPSGRAVLEPLRWLVLPAELALLAYLAVLARRAFRGAARETGDFVTRLRATARRVLGRRIPADILTTEIAILHYALRWPRRRPPAPGSFTVHREVGLLSVLIGLLLLLAVEVIALHALVTLWGPTATWILSGLSVYAVLWLLGDYRAMNARPTRLTPTGLSLRVGVRWEAEIPLDAIVWAGALAASPETGRRDSLDVALLGQPDLEIRLDRDVEVTGMYGVRRTARVLRLRVDRSRELRAALRALGIEGGAPAGTGRMLVGSAPPPADRPRPPAC